MMPYGLFESPAFWLIWALALRTGLVWFWRAPGFSLAASLRRQVRAFPIALAGVVPVPLVSALLRTYVAPTVWNRYFVGIGLSPDMTEEARVIADNRWGFDALAELSVSPDGKALACTDSSQRLLWRADIDGRHWAPELEASQWTFLSPSWSADSREIAVVWSPYDGPGRLIIVDPKVKKQRTIAGGPAGRYLSAAWSHSGHTIAVATMRPSTEPGEQDRGPTTIWLIDAASSQWTKLLTLPAASRAAIVPGLTWRPDDKEIAFTRLAGTRPGTQIWAVSVPDGRLRQITRGATDALPSWSPDGRWVAFISRPLGRDTNRFGAMLWDLDRTLGEIALVHPDGTSRADHIAKADPYAGISWVSPTRLLYDRNETLIYGSPRVLAGSH